MAECKDESLNKNKTSIFDHPCVRSVIRTLEFPEVFGDDNYDRARSAYKYRSLRLSTYQMTCFSKVILGSDSRNRSMSKQEILSWVLMQYPRFHETPYKNEE